MYYIMYHVNQSKEHSRCAHYTHEDKIWPYLIVVWKREYYYKDSFTTPDVISCQFILPRKAICWNMLSIGNYILFTPFRCLSTFFFLAV